MALVLANIDKTVLQTLSGAVGWTTLPHSLGTTPDEVRFQLRSLNTGSYAIPISEGGNSTLLTIGTAGGNGTAAFNVIAVYWWQPTR